MDRRFLHYFFVITLLFFIGSVPVSAKENCVSVKSELEKYDSYVNLLSSIDCTDNSNETNVATCNEFNVRKNIIVTDLMKKSDEKQICSNEKRKVNQIIKENKDNCGQIFNEDFNKFVKNVMIIFYIAGPILLILFGSLDFAKATVSSEKDALKKASINFAKRLTATLLLFLTPTIINIILSFNISDKYLSGNAYTCNYKYSVFNKKYTITYVPRTNSNRNNNSSYNVNGGTIIEVAEQVYNKYRRQGWYYYDATPYLPISYNIESQLHNPNKVTCCATYVAEVLYSARIIGKDVMNSYNYNLANSGISKMLEDQGWIKITDYNSLQPGDIVFNSEHVQIFVGIDSVGNRLYYSMGSNEAVRRTEQPYGGYMSPPGSANCSSCFTHAYRQP